MRKEPVSELAKIEPHRENRQERLIQVRGVSGEQKTTRCGK